MTNVGILIKFTIIADQIQMFINVTGYQHKTIFFCCRHILRSWMKCIKQRITYILYISTFWFYRNQVGCIRADEFFH